MIDEKDIPIGSIILVNWIDAHEGVERFSFINGELKVVSIGLAVGIKGRKPNRFLVIAKEIVADGHLHYNCIPISNITSVKTIRKKPRLPLGFLKIIAKKVQKARLNQMDKTGLGGWI